MYSIYSLYYLQEEQSRDKRDSVVTELLHTHTVLEGDYNLYAVIHWSGLKKSNVVFILTFNYSDVSIQFIYQLAFSLNVFSSDISTNESKQLCQNTGHVI